MYELTFIGIRIDGLVGLIGLNRVLPALAFGLTCFRKSAKVVKS